MLNLKGKLIFFISSYSPMFIIISILYAKYTPNVGIKENILQNIPSIILLVIFCIVTYSVIYLINIAAKNNQPEVLYIKKKSNVNNSILEYMVSYIFPFLIEFKNVSFQQFIAMVIFFILLFIVYRKTDLIFINPVLNMFGYNVFEVEFSDNNLIKVGYLITKQESFDLKEVEKVYTIHNNVFLLK